MKKGNWPVGLLMCLLVSGCDASSRNSLFDVFGYPSRSQEALSKDRQELADTLLPQEGLTRRRFRLVYEATLRVTHKRREDLSEDIRIFRTYFNSLSLSQLQNIERILPDVEANPQLRWTSED